MDEKPEPTPGNSTLTPHSKMTLFVGVPITLIILGIAVWALLSGMPFATDSKPLTRTEQPAPAVINEQSGTTATTSQIRTPGEQAQEPVATTTTALPAGMPAPAAVTPPPAAPPPPQPTATQPVVAPAPKPRATQPAVAPAPKPTATQPAAPAPVPAPIVITRRPRPAARPPQTSSAAAGEITDSQAEDVLRNFVVSRDYYQLGSAECVGTVVQGYKNRGYAIDVVDRCGDRGRVGRWRVDSLTREVFVQKADGRYLRP